MGGSIEDYDPAGHLYELGHAAERVAAAVEAGILTTVLDEFQLPTQPVSLVYAAGRFLPIKLRAFLDFAAPRLRARLA